MKKLIILFGLVFLVACGSGGGGSGSSPAIPDIYTGSYVVAIVNGVNVSDLGYTVTITSTQFIANIGCQIVDSVTGVSGNRIYFKVTSTNCSNVTIGAEEWDEFSLQGDRLSFTSDDGGNGLLIRI